MQDTRAVKFASAYRPVTPMTEIPDDLPPLLTVRTAAAIGGFSENFVRVMLRSGEISGTRVGRVWRVNRDAYLKQLGLDQRQEARVR